MKKKNSAKIVHNQEGVTIVLFGIIVVALFAFIAMAIDGSNLFLAWTKMQNFSDAANFTALNVRIERGPQMRDLNLTPTVANPAPAGLYQCAYANIPVPVIDESCVRQRTSPVAANLLKRNLDLIGIATDDTPTNNGATGPYTISNANGGVATLTAEINYKDCRAGVACINPEDNTDISANTTNEFEYFTTEITYDVPLLLMHLVPFQMLGVTGGAMANTVRLVTTSQAILPAINVALLPDFSGSMNDTVNGVQKVDELKLALRGFVDNFRPDRDKVSFWPFNIQTSPASIAVTKNIDQGFVIGDPLPTGTTGMRGAINAVAATGNTNPVDAMLAAYEDFRTRGAEPIAGTGDLGLIQYLLSGTKGEYSMVLFTDGAPTAMTAKFNEYPTAGNAAGVYSTVFEIAYKDSTITKLEDDIDSPDYIVGHNIMRAHPGPPGPTSCPDGYFMDGNHISGSCNNPLPVPHPPGCDDAHHWCTSIPWGMPSNFYQTSIIRTDPISGNPNPMFGRLYGKTDYGVPGDRSGSTTAMSLKPLTEDSNHIADAWPAPLPSPGPTPDPVLDDLGFTMPTAALFGMTMTTPVASEASLLDDSKTVGTKTYPIGFQRQFYHNLIATSDFVRSQLGYIYTVGLGNAAPVDPDPNKAKLDPYQDVADSSSRKDNLLARVAGDTSQVTNQFGFTSPYNNNNACLYAKNVAPNSSCRSWDTTDPDRKRRDGHYIPTNDPSKLFDIFQRVARQIQNKVVINPKSRVLGLPG